MSDVISRETAGMEVNADKPAPFVPTWGPEWEYVANHGTVFTFLLDDKSDVAPIKLACEFGDVWFSRDGSAAFGASWVIVSQRPRTTAPVETKSSPKDRSPCCGASVSHVLMCDHCASEFLPETPAPSQPADVPQSKYQWPKVVRQLLEDCAAEAVDVIGNKLPWSRDSLEARFAPHFKPVLAIIARHAVAATEVAELERLRALEARLQRSVDLDQKDLETIRDGTKMTRAGIVQMLAYGNEEIAELKVELTALRERLAAAERERDAIRVQWQSIHDEREEQFAALRRRGIRFVKVGGVLEAIGSIQEHDMLKSPQSQADIDEALSRIDAALAAGEKR